MFNNVRWRRFSGTNSFPILSVFLALLLAACSGPDQQAGASPGSAVAVWMVEPEELVTRRQWYGRLEPLQSTAVQAARSGRISSVAVREGDWVDAGDLLLEISVPDVDQRREVLRAQRQALEENLQRWEMLLERNSVAAAEVMEARLRLLDISESLVQLEAELDYNRLTASVSGRVRNLAAYAGNHVEEGQVLLQLDDHHSWGMRTSIAAREVVHLGRSENLRLQDSLGRSLTLDRLAVTSGPDQMFASVEFYLTETPDQFGELQVIFEAVDSVLLVPWTSIASDQSGTWVAVVDREQGQERGVIRRQHVALGRSHAAGVEALEGISAGDLVVRFQPRAHPVGRQVQVRITR